MDLILSSVLAAISGKDVLESVLYIIMLGIVCYLAWWLITFAEAKFASAKIAAPIFAVAKVIVAIAAVLILINILLTLIGHPIFRW